MRFIDAPVWSKTMVTFQVNDMTCGHCVGTITKAVKAIDANAQVNIDLAQHLVEIESTDADATKLGAAIGAAGYAAVPVAGAVAVASQSRPTTRSGCCCN